MYTVFRLLNETEIEEIRSTTIRDVILRTNPELDGDFDIQENPFLWNPAEGPFGVWFLFLSFVKPAQIVKICLWKTDIVCKPKT